MQKKLSLFGYNVNIPHKFKSEKSGASLTFICMGNNVPDKEKVGSEVGDLMIEEGMRKCHVHCTLKWYKSLCYS